MGIFDSGKKTGGFMDVIRCDEPSYLIWKWHPKDTESGNNRRENAIRFGSSLRVKDGEVAVFVYNQKDGTKQDFIVGPFDEILKTKNLPILTRILGLAYEGDTPFQAEVYFINLAKIVQVKFAVPYFDIYDPRLETFGIPVAVRGTISFQIKDYKEFIKLHRLSNFNLDDFQNQIRDVVTRYVKDAVLNAPAANNIPLLQLESKTGIINDKVELDIKERLEENFGVLVSGVDINNIEFDKSSEGYKQLLSVTKDVQASIIEAETAAKLKDIADKQRIDMENYQETLRVEREESQYAKHKQTENANINAYQIEKQAEVGVAGANALGKMGENGAGNINLGDGGSGGGTNFNPASLMANIALGGVVGQKIAGTMKGIMSDTDSVIADVPPAIPVVKYYAAINDKSTGPFDMKTLEEMILAGTISKDTLVWQKGMSDWVKASAVKDLEDLFVTMPPIPKTEEDK